MSLNKTITRLEKIRQANRAFRLQGAPVLTDPGPRFAIQPLFQFDPTIFLGLLQAESPPDTTHPGGGSPPST